MSDDTLSMFPEDEPAAVPPSAAAAPSVPVDAPLAERMRPTRLGEVVGQDELLGDNGVLRRMLDAGRLPSLILHGPPGTGKTTLARLLAAEVGASFVPFSAVSEGVPRLREVVKEAEARRRGGRKTLLFVDEIHRLHKGQQDFLLPSVESGLLTLVGATTEHPAFEVNAALLSRARVLVLEPLASDDIMKLVERALADETRGLGGSGNRLDADAERVLVEAAGGDARRALNTLEIAASLAGDDATISADDIREAVQYRVAGYDKTTAFEMLSAFHKSLRSSDGSAALYWAMRMVNAGEDPLVLFRRLVAAAYEDVGMADPRAGMIAVQAMQAFERLGHPEGLLPLSTAVLYVATAPKSNRAYLALNAAGEAAEQHPDAPVPLHLRNASSSLMRDWGYGEGYKYAHDYKGGYVQMECLPEELAGSEFYQPGPLGYEGRIAERLKQRGDSE